MMSVRRQVWHIQPEIEADMADSFEAISGVAMPSSSTLPEGLVTFFCSSKKAEYKNREG
jgi:hypothetical protein